MPSDCQVVFHENCTKSDLTYRCEILAMLENRLIVVPVVVVVEDNGFVFFAWHQLKPWGSFEVRRALGPPAFTEPKSQQPSDFQPHQFFRYACLY